MEKSELGVIALIAKNLADLKAAFGTLSKQAGPAGKDGKDGVSIKGDAGKDGKDGRDGKDGLSVRGKAGKDGRDGKDGKDGERGPIGPMPKHKWTGTQLQFEKPDGKWGRAVDLKGEAGKDGGGVTRLVGVGGNGSSFDPSGLPAANDALPSEFIVKQGDVWVRATYEQMQAWLGGGVVPDTNRVLVGTDRVMVGDQIVRVTE